MKKILIVGIALTVMPAVSFAQTATTTTTPAPAAVIADAGLVPGDFFYFLDRWTEALNLTLTFNKEKKARKLLEYAKERVAEINDVLKKPEAKLEEVAKVKDDFNTQVNDAANIIKSESAKGIDVSNLAKELSDELDVSRDGLKQSFHDYQKSTSQAESVIRAKIAEIVASGTASSTSAEQLQGLTQALESITKEKIHAAEEENGVDESVSEEDDAFYEAMGSEKAAKKHLEKVMEIQAHLNEVSTQFGNISASSEQLMKDAQAAILRGDFETAKNMSKAAERVLERAKEAQQKDFETHLKDSNDEGERTLDIEETKNTEHINSLESDVKTTERSLNELER